MSRKGFRIEPCFVNYYSIQITIHPISEIINWITLSFDLNWKFIGVFSTASVTRTRIMTDWTLIMNKNLGIRSRPLSADGRTER